MTGTIQNTDPTLSMLNDILHELRRQGAQDDDLWDTESIAIYMKLGKGAVHNKILKASGFPSAVVLPSGGRRWVAKEVKAWIIRHRITGSK